MLYIGLMSGTSLDGIDAAVVEISTDGQQLLASHYQAYSESLKKNIEAVSFAPHTTLDEIALLDQTLGQLYAQAVNDLLAKANIDKSQIHAIGCHGQTIRHQAKANNGKNFSWQLGDANQLAELSGINVVADFRRRDIAAGGEGAPLAPAFHLAAFAADDCARQILNLGGIANISLLDHSTQSAMGYDIGPANCLMDEWVMRHWQKDYDQDGLLAKQGTINTGLLAQWQAHPAFAQIFELAPPKSTGREVFNLNELEKATAGLEQQNPHDVLASLVEFSAINIAQAVNKWGNKQADIFVCGGGAHNQALLTRIQALLPELKVASSETLGIHPDWVEAAAFAWLAYRSVNHLAGNLPAVTGAKGERVLGAFYPA